MKIYTPPIITAKAKISYGHGVNLVFCDILARVDRNLGGKPQLFLPSWNNQGKRSENVSLDKTNTEKEINEIEKRLETSLKPFGLDTFPIYRDNSTSSRELSQKAFSTLQAKGFILRKEDGSYVLSIGKIVRDTDLRVHLERANYFPNHAGIKKRALDLITNLDGEYPIAKERTFATALPAEPDSPFKINPIFDLGVSPLLLSQESVDYSIDGSRTLLHGTIIPFIIWSGLKDVPFSRNVYVHGYAHLGKGIKDIPLDELAKKYGSDTVRFTLMSVTSSLEDKIIDEGVFHRGRKVVNKIKNLGKYFVSKNVNLDFLWNNSQVLERYLHTIVSEVVEEISEETLKISADVSKNGASTTLIKRYSDLLVLSQPVLPSTYSEIREMNKR